MKKIRVGVIGTGYLGKFHAEKYAKMDDVEFIGVVDIDKSKADEVAGQYNVGSYTDIGSLIGKVDAVSIVVSTPAHFAVSKAFLENNVDVLIEKPMTTSIEEADELIQLASSRDLIIQVGHLERFNPAVIALQDIVKNPRFIETHRLSVYKDRCTDVSVVLDLMIHDIDLISNFIGSEVKNIHAAGTPVITGHTDIANARIEFKNGCVANVTASRISAKNERKIRLFQKDTYISVDFAKHEITVIRKKGGNESGSLPGMGIKQISLPEGDALDEELKAFIKTVKKRELPKVTGTVGRDALAIALNIMEQIDTKI